jgi:hypothetical protein
MGKNRQLQQILVSTRTTWDQPVVRSAVRTNFQKVIDCRTPVLGAEKYASDTEETVVYHTCKSRVCPSCGYRATQLWQREQWAALPDMAYVGLVLTMPDVFWPVFRNNRRLLFDLPVLGAAAVKAWARTRCGIEHLVLVVPHTFGRRLNFHPHLHLLVSAGALHQTTGRWIPRVRFDKDAIMRIWRLAVITYLREALKAGLLGIDSRREFATELKFQSTRWWNIHVSRFQSKGHFLRYAGRYLRRPPIAQHRLIDTGNGEVQFTAKDLKLNKIVTIRCPAAEFVRTLADHVPDHYRHAVRYFGLLSPRKKARNYGAIFLLTGQSRRPKPHRLPWATSLFRTWGRNPLVDSQGIQMRWVGRILPA